MAKEHAFARSKVARAMREQAEGKLHSGSKHGPLVKSKAQAAAIGYSEARERKGKKHKGKKEK